MRVNRVTFIGLCVVFALILSAGTVPAQFGSLKKKAEEKAKKEVEKKIDPPKETPQPATPSEPAEGTEAQPQSDAAAQKPGEGVWLNYDFVPGSRVIFFDDLMAEQVGNFPRRFEFVEGNMEVAEWNQMRWLRCSTTSKFAIPLPEDLPQKFTFEFDIYSPAQWGVVAIIGGDDEAEQTEIHVDALYKNGGLKKYPSALELAVGKVAETAFNQAVHCRVMADGKYIKVYLNETRVANVPNADFFRTRNLHFRTISTEESPLLFGNFRIASSDKTIYDALAADGRVATHGIFFDSGSDRLRPESTPTLKEIGQMLKDHADLSVLIEGHTDNVGDDAANQSLSERRASAVRDHLIAQYGIDGSRLQAKGFGETKPVAGNDTPEGRQNNRRVELVKL